MKSIWILPLKAILAASSTSGEVTRRPATLRVSRPMSLHSLSRPQPPPWTITRGMEKLQSRASCSQTERRTDGSSRISPPSLITNGWWRKRRTYWAALRSDSKGWVCWAMVSSC